VTRAWVSCAGACSLKRFSARPAPPLIRSLAFVAAVFATGTLVGNPVPVTIAEAKSSLPWATVRALVVLIEV
jgi:hypothetical protein